MLTASDSPSTNYAELIPPETYLAVCIGVYDLGDQFSPFYKKSSRKCRLAFELVDHKVPNKEGVMEPAIVGREFTLSLSDKGNLRPFLQSWRGKPFSEAELKAFSLETLIGAACMVSIIHQKSTDGAKTYVNISGAMKLMKGVKKPSASVECICFHLDKGNFSSAMFDKLPEFVQTKIKGSETWNEIFGKESLDSQDVEDGQPVIKVDDDLPF